MSPFFALLMLFLPSFTLATTTVSTNAINCSVFPSLCPNETDLVVSADLHARPPHPVGGLDIKHADGDILNSTRCYCASPNWKNDHLYGYYFDTTYYNFHKTSLYNVKTTCLSDDFDKYPLPYHNFRIVPVCLRTMAHEKWCSSDAINNGNVWDTFCYEFGDKDFYWWNHQKRAVPVTVAARESQVDTLTKCDALCNEKIEGTMVLDGEALLAVNVKRDEVVQNSIVSFSDTDDMCEGCK